MEALALPLKEVSQHPSYEVHRFSEDGVVVVRDSRSSVFMGGFLLGEFGEQDKDRGPRNVLIVTLAKSEMLHLGRLAVVFGMTEEYLRQLRRKEEAGGLGALLLSKQAHSFAAIGDVFRAMEDAGTVRRGFFVENLEGAQFAWPGAIDRLREITAGQTQRVMVIAALDPACA